MEENNYLLIHNGDTVSAEGSLQDITEELVNGVMDGEAEEQYRIYLAVEKDFTVRHKEPIVDVAV